MKNIKLHFIALCLVVISEYIGIVKFNLGKGVIALFPMLYAMIFGVLTKYLKIANEKDMEDAGSLVSVTLLLLMAKYGTTIGPSFPKIIFINIKFWIMMRINLSIWINFWIA